ncbi:hypothetical protein Hypma_016253 [Hypsizygus marmoreus]|uniref:Uncharacterized protein n=1 Tax=Hypsizygus marmoreus TaxID=39966 RepID=A0A369IYV0_HYPMA|nr:hypothetical protein Hypma_016253 [Hypsizygus marmoreus]
MLSEDWSFPHEQHLVFDHEPAGRLNLTQLVLVPPRSPSPSVPWTAISSMHTPGGPEIAVPFSLQIPLPTRSEVHVVNALHQCPDPLLHSRMYRNNCLEHCAPLPAILVRAMHIALEEEERLGISKENIPLRPPLPVFDEVVPSPNAKRSLAAAATSSASAHAPLAP